VAVPSVVVLNLGVSAVSCPRYLPATFVDLVEVTARFGHGRRGARTISPIRLPLFPRYFNGCRAFPLQTDCRQHACTRFSSALQCPLERRRKGLIGCDQLLALGGRVGGGDSWAGLAVVVTLQSTHAHIVCDSGVGAKLQSLFKMLFCGRWPTPAAGGKFLMRSDHLTGAAYHQLNHEAPPMAFAALSAAAT
jgi:hypothetical protein